MRMCERPSADTVGGGEVERVAVGRGSVRAGDLDLWRCVTCNPSQDDATVKCWGGNWYGQLGYGDTRDRGDGSNGGCPARPTRGCGGREEAWGWWLTVLPWDRDGGEASCGRSGGWEDGCLGLRGQRIHLRVAGKLRMGRLGIGAKRNRGPVGLRGIWLLRVGNQ